MAYLSMALTSKEGNPEATLARGGFQAPRSSCLWATHDPGGTLHVGHKSSLSGVPQGNTIH